MDGDSVTSGGAANRISASVSGTSRTSHSKVIWAQNAQRQGMVQTATSTRHLLKDVDLVIKAAESVHLATEGLEGIRSLLTKTIAQGLGSVDYSALYEAIDPARDRKPE